MNVSIDNAALGQLNTAEARALLTNSLSALGIGRLVNLPQIIVVGGQSSGKSSVLEALTRFRFPVEEGGCTRFATEIILRYAEETRVDISVKFADISKSVKTFQRTSFSENDLPGIVKEARDSMDFSGGNRGFSKDVLRLEIEGPNMHPLTLVDLPGIYQNETEDQTLEGMEIVNETVEGYMKQKNSIILAVIAANTDLANHIALRKVKEHDASRERTIGVITKPDLALPGYDHERTYIRVAQNEESTQRLRLGWHVVRNRAENEPNLAERNAIEDRFFSSGAWNSIPAEDRGVVSLRIKLSRVQFHHIGNALPGVIDEIEKKHEERLAEQARLGKPRSGVSEKRSFLLDVANRFQHLARDGILGHYKDGFFGGMDGEDRKLRAQLRNFNRAFDYVLRTKGSARLIGRHGPLLEEHVVVPSPPHLTQFLQRYPYPFRNPERVAWEVLNAELQAKASINQGSELPGLPNTELAIQLFQTQAEPWERIAKYHLRQVMLTTQAFVDEIFTSIMGPPENNNATEAVLRGCVDPFFRQKETLLQKKLDELLRPYVQGYAFPLDADFHRATSGKSLERLTDLFMDTMQKAHPDIFDEKPKQGLSRQAISSALSRKQNFDGGEFGTERVIDMMQSYYETSRRTFTENVINLAVESCLICDIPNILTPTQVDSMTEKRLKELALEPEDVQSRREHLEKEIEALREGKELCYKYRPRTVTARPSPGSSVQPTPESPLTANSSTSNESATGHSTSPVVWSQHGTPVFRPPSMFGDRSAQGPPTRPAFGTNWGSTASAPAGNNSRGGGLFGSQSASRSFSGPGNPFGTSQRPQE
ncbi:P-loop containing nucleoside triphosphate hydrolase protein [Thelonectria olida]|uniref:P-loop containing nucleoside triphosphate hydrolase protein n=1 Tax=Thelonectria olida TaxID=1576542 RepID=A0A9P8VZT2_9HYPO|nr:P-loop containing nucleoside triphosphate hydrolase protein [Thelonectria olida]